MIIPFTYLQNILDFANSSFLVVFLHTISLITLSTVLFELTKQKKGSKSITIELSILMLFIVPVIAIMFENLGTICKELLPHTIPARITSCIAWMISCFKYHCFLLFIEKLTLKDKKLSLLHYAFYTIEIVLCSLILFDYAHLIQFNCRSSYASNIYYSVIVLWIVSIIPSVITIMSKLSDQKIPYLVKRQLTILLSYFLLPSLITILIEFAPFLLTGQLVQIVAFTNLSLILITASIYYCFKKILQFRFLNFSNQVQVKYNIPTETDFKDSIEHINIATNEQELNYITQEFCSKNLGLQKSDVLLYTDAKNQGQDHQQKIIEQFLYSNNPDTIAAIELLHRKKILIRHEIEFDEFYTDNVCVVQLAQFLRSIHADIFLPIIMNQKIQGYIFIGQQQSNKIYTLDQQNKLIVFGKFLAPAIYLIQQKNTLSLLQENKTTKELLHEKTQEINQYKESIKQLLKDRIEYHIGIIFYKNKSFTFKNQEAQALIGINLNLEQDHPTTQVITHFAQQVEKYQITQTTYITVAQGTKLILTGMPQTDANSGTLLIIRKPEATDMIKMHMDNIHNASDRDYLLYLETTTAGKTINNLLPSSQESFLQIKIKLLQSVLQRNTLFIDGNINDINNIIDVIRKLSPTKDVYTLELDDEQNGTLKLFGINPLLTPNYEMALLEKYHQGTIIIKNIEKLEGIAQYKLIQYIKYGIFTPIKSEQRKITDARIICTTEYNLDTLYTEKHIIPELYQELKKHSVIIPSLITMKSSQLLEIIDDYIFQILQQHSPQHVQALTLKEKEILTTKRIPSLVELKQKIYSLMVLKAQDKLVLEQQIKPAIPTHIDTTCPELQLAAQLGKHALKDVQLMQKLWKKLGSQTKIADLLGVNRSSVNRRCKDYDLM